MTGKAASELMGGKKKNEVGSITFCGNKRQETLDHSAVHYKAVGKGRFEK